VVFLLDANVLIDANRDYYPLERVPEFWDWLLYHAQDGSIKVPLEVYEEVADGNDAFAAWIRTDAVRDALLLREDADPELVARIVDEGYAADLTDEEVVRIGRDPFLVAYAAAHPGRRAVVTTEGSRPSRQRANRHVPDVCAQFHVPCYNTFELTRRLDFSTTWRPPQE
jgi:hypothetical protein